MEPEILNIVKVFGPAAVGFFVGIGITPVVANFLYTHKLWKKKSVSVSTDGHATPITAKLHNDEERKTPRMGGVIVWASALITVLLFWLGAIIDGPLLEKLNFLSRNQTWLPLFTLVVGGIIGLIDDYLVTTDRLDDYVAGGLSLKKRLSIVLLVSLIGAWWFFTKLDVTSVIVPFLGEFNIGLWFVPFFALVMIGTYSGGVIDGIDGLAGGVFAIIFSAYGAIAFFQNQIDLAALCVVIVGGLLAFLWFNIPPARFYRSDTGTMALTMTLTVIAFLTKQVLILPIIAFPLVISAGSSLAQVLSKRFRRGKKIFLAAPIHHHFQALGWPGYKVTMRYWVITIVLAIIGMIIALIG